MKLGIVLNTNDPEEVWNCLRFGVSALKNKHIVKIFLLGKGVELEEMKIPTAPRGEVSLRIVGIFKVANTLRKKLSKFTQPSQATGYSQQMNGEKFNVKGLLAEFAENNGSILACGTCLKSRQKKGSSICPISTMKDLLKLVEESDKILTFG